MVVCSFIQGPLKKEYRLVGKTLALWSPRIKMYSRLCLLEVAGSCRLKRGTVYGAAPKPPCDCFGQYQIAVASIVCMKSSEYFQITFQLVTKPEKVSNVFSLYNFSCKLWVTASEQNNHNKVFGAASSLPLILPSDSQQSIPNWLERTHFSLRTGSYKHSLTSLWSTK